MLRFGLDEATVRADGGRGEVKGGWGRRRAPDVHPYVLGICEGMEGRCAKGKGTGLWTLGAAHRPSRMPPTAQSPSVRRPENLKNRNFHDLYCVPAGILDGIFGSRTHPWAAAYVKLLQNGE